MSMFKNATSVYIEDGHFIIVAGNGNIISVNSESVDVTVTRTRVQIDSASLEELGREASLHQGQNNWEKAEMLRLEESKGRANVFGLENRDTIQCMEGLAHIYRSQDKWDDARRVEAVLREINRRTLCPLWQDTLQGVTRLRLAWENWEKVVMWSEEKGVRVQEEELRKALPATLDAVNGLAEMVDGCKKAFELSTKIDYSISGVSRNERYMKAAGPDIPLLLYSIYY